MSKTLEEQIEKVIQSCWYSTPMSNNDTQFNSDKCLDECAKVAQIFALEQQIEILGKVSIESEEASKELDKIYLELKCKLKALKDGKE